MAHKLCFETLDRMLNDIMKEQMKSNLVFGGDFRQILPVIPRGSRSDIVQQHTYGSTIKY